MGTFLFYLQHPVVKFQLIFLVSAPCLFVLEIVFFPTWIKILWLTTEKKPYPFNEIYLARCYWPNTEEQRK